MAESIVVWTATAAMQRRDILKYWTQKTHSSDYAKKLIKLINKRIKIILQYPSSWRLCAYPGCRISAMGHYSIVYKITEQGIIITSFWDNRQRPEERVDLFG